jgi:hypothetical protein
MQNLKIINMDDVEREYVNMFRGLTVTPKLLRMNSSLRKCPQAKQADGRGII